MTLRTEHNITCEAPGCSERAVFHLTWARARRTESVQHYCDEHAQVALSNHDFNEPVGPGELSRTSGARCFDIELVVICETHDEQAVYLREVRGRRNFPILIGIFEATSIDRKLQDFKAPRPLTHDAIFSAIQALSGELEDVLIDRLDNCQIDGVETKMYFAKLRIRQNVRLVSVDVRPSDALAVALIAEKPIFVADSVLDALLSQPRKSK